jgi:hypothetical protein
MSNYGLQLWNANGELVYSSLNKTVQVIGFGVVDITDLTTRFTVDFTPTLDSPELWIGGQGLTAGAQSGGYFTRLFKIASGNFIKNGNDEYYRFSVGWIQGPLVPALPSQISGLSSYIVHVPWVVFI